VADAAEGVHLLARGDVWAVVHKPAGLPVHRSRHVRRGPTLVALSGQLLDMRVDPVHRLDQPVSGCLLLSLDRAATPSLQARLAAGSKRYVAMVRGHIDPREPHRVTRPLKVEGSLKECETLLTPVASSREPRCSLVLAEPRTGRYHQIRRHLRGLDHPVLGDSMHGDTRVNRHWRDEHALPRLAMHCLSLSLPGDGDAAPIEALAPLPDDLRALFTAMPWWAEAVAALPELEAR